MTQDVYNKKIIAPARKALNNLLFGGTIYPANNYDLERRKEYLREARENCRQLIDEIDKELNEYKGGA